MGTPVAGSEHARSMRARLLALLPAPQAALWVALAIAGPRLFGAVFTIALRRFLGPGVSGIFDLANTPYRFLDNFRSFGTGPALIYERRMNREVANTAWSVNMLSAVLITVLAELLAHPIAVYYGQPAVEEVLRVLAIGYVFASISSVHYFLLLRDLNFRARSLPTLGQVIAGGCAAVLFAVWGFGVGALVARELASVIAGSLLLWLVYPYRPSPDLVLPVARQLLRYGAWVGAGLAMLFVSQNVDIFIGGHIIHNANDIGFYTTSWRVAFLAAGVFSIGATSMVFPTLSRLQDDPEALTKKLLKAIRQTAVIMFPLSWILAVTAPVLIVPLLGSKFAPYRESFLVLSLLAVYAGNRTIVATFFEGYKSVGRPWIVWAYNSVKLAVMVPIMIFGAYHGTLGLAAAYIPIQILEIPAALALARRVLGVSLFALWRSVRVTMASTLLMAAAAIATEVAVLRHAGDTAALLLSLAVGGTVYLACLFLLDRRLLAEARSVLFRGL